MRDIDLINVSVADMQLFLNKCNFYASQTQDPAIRNLLQDVARMHQQHVATLSMVRGQIQQQLGAAQPTPQQIASPAFTGTGLR